MKLSMQLTLDGLVHAMRVKAHEVAEAVENGRADGGGVRDPRSDALPPAWHRMRGGEHDRRRA